MTDFPEQEDWELIPGTAVRTQLARAVTWRAAHEARCRRSPKRLRRRSVAAPVSAAGTRAATRPISAPTPAARRHLRLTATQIQIHPGHDEQVNAVPIVMPAAITRPIENRAAAPGRSRSSSGTIAITSAAVVISTGRRRIAAASSIASRFELPARAAGSRTRRSGCRASRSRRSASPDRPACRC